MRNTRQYVSLKVNPYEARKEPVDRRLTCFFFSFFFQHVKVLLLLQTCKYLPRLPDDGLPPHKSILAFFLGYSPLTSPIGRSTSRSTCYTVRCRCAAAAAISPCSSRCNKMMENEFYRIVKVYLITAALTRLAFQGSCSLSSSLSLSQFFQFYFSFYQEHADHHHHQQQHMPWNVVC